MKSLMLKLIEVETDERVIECARISGPFQQDYIRAAEERGLDWRPKLKRKNRRVYYR